MADKLYVRETYLNADKGYTLGAGKVEESSFHTTSAMFRWYRRNEGRCISYMYRDNPDTGIPERIGWVFQKRVLYSDARKQCRTKGNGQSYFGYQDLDYYLQEVWVEVHTAMPTTVTTYHVKVL